MFGAVDEADAVPAPPSVPKFQFPHPLRRLRQFVCGLFGHDMMMKFARRHGRGRMFLRCQTCGYDSTGWIVGDNPPVITQPGDMHFHRVKKIRT